MKLVGVIFWYSGCHLGALIWRSGHYHGSSYPSLSQRYSLVLTLTAGSPGNCWSLVPPLHILSWVLKLHGLCLTSRSVRRTTAAVPVSSDRKLLQILQLGAPAPQCQVTRTLSKIQERRMRGAQIHHDWLGSVVCFCDLLVKLGDIGRT